MTFNLNTPSIAITGMAGRFPGARNLDEFWTMLRDGVEGIRQFSEAELLGSGIPRELIQHPDYVRASGALADPDLFDAPFFGFSPREAELTDPQRRLFLETCWHALEDAGTDPARFPGLIGVFGGAGMNGYFIYNLLSRPDLSGEPVSLANAITNDKDFLATQAAYKMNLRGPALTVQTACSTSLVAAHLAVQSLLNGECDMALAGGVLVTVPPVAGYLFEEGGIKSRDGHCRAFDVNADGTVGGNGVGVVALKRLADALADGDRVYAVIRGSAINNDGAGKVGFTAPGVDGQAAVIAEALALAGFSADTIGYVEAHGTATRLGDPIEIAALTQAFRLTTDRRGYCAIGSVKTNVGHLDAAAGVTGLIKAALALHHRQIPPSLHYTAPNPEIDFANSPFFVNAELREWAAGGHPRRAGVSSFGIGGTNAHMVLEEAPPAPASRATRAAELLVLSARTATALERLIDNLTARLERQPDAALPAIARTLQTGRARFGTRRTLVARDPADALAALKARDPRRIFTAARQADATPVVFLLPGQGAQYPGMARGLYHTEPVFRAWLDRLAGLFSRELEMPLLNVILETGDGRRETGKPDSLSPISNTQFAQPALFAVEYALAQLLISWGIQPAAMLGHSLGEYTAAALAGVFALEDACRIVAARGRCMAACEPGAMLAISLSEEAVQPYLNGGIELAAVNEPGSVVVSGSFAAIEQLELELQTQSIAARRLHTSHAFHSARMEPALAPFRDALHPTGLHPPRTPFISNVSGTWIAPEQAASPDYWVSQLRQTVRFSAGVQTVLSDPECVLLEVGPGTTLTSLARAHIREAGRVCVSTMRHPRETADDRETLLDALGRLWAAGVDVDWDGYWGGAPPPKVGLPGYPFEGRRYWVEGGRDGDRKKVEGWFYVPVWKRMPAAPAPWAGGRKWLIVGEAGDLAAGLEAAGQTARRAASADAADFGAFLPDEIVVDGAAVEFGALANLVARLAKAAPAHAAGITILTASLHSVTGAEMPDHAAAPLIGLLRVVPQEYPQFTARNVDVEQYDSSLARRLTAEAVTTGGSVIACRGAHRWVQAFEPYPLPAGNAPIREGGVYVITGGSGKIGQAIARWLARTAGVRIALISRKGGGLNLPKPETLTLAADVADAGQLQAALDTVRARWGRIDGVFHAAGFAGEGAFAGLDRITPEYLARHLAPKCRGTANLAAALAGDAPDFIVLVSSLSSVLGGLGYAAYAAANACLDAHAAQQGWLSINFDGWGDDGHALTLEEGIDALERILAQGLTGQILVSATDLGARLARWASPSGGGDPHTGGRVPRGDAAARGESLSPHYTAPRSETEQAVARIWGDLLGIAQVGAHDNFFDLGGHSLLAIQAASRLRVALNVDVPVQAFFEAQTVAELAARLAPADEVDALAALMGGLSEEEIRALLEETE
jgi:acyl transferase domain-containing protein